MFNALGNISKQLNQPNNQYTMATSTMRNHPFQGIKLTTSEYHLDLDIYPIHPSISLYQLTLILPQHTHTNTLKLPFTLLDSTVWLCSHPLSHLFIYLSNYLLASPINQIDDQNQWGPQIGGLNKFISLDWKDRVVYVQTDEIKTRQFYSSAASGGQPILCTISALPKFNFPFSFSLFSPAIIIHHGNRSKHNKTKHNQIEQNHLPCLSLSSGLLTSWPMEACQQTLTT